MRVHFLLLLASAAIAFAEDKVDHSMDPSFYRCPFSMFDAGRPALLDSGEVWYCDAPDAKCPSWYFCSAGHPDGRNVCCHILGV